MGLFLQVWIERKDLGAYNEPWIFFWQRHVRSYCERCIGYKLAIVESDNLDDAYERWHL